MKMLILKKIASRKHFNEYACHVYFVYKIAMELQKRYGGSRKIISAASLLHDAGRDADDRPHEIVGAEIAKRELKKLGFKEEEIKRVSQCILAHGAKEIKPKTLEEKIIASADGAAKVLYAPLFGLLSRKEPYEKPAWVLKHIEKGYRKICLPEFKKEIKKAYMSIKRVYEESIDEQKRIVS